MLGCLDFLCQFLPQIGSLEGAGPCNFSFSELACHKTNQRGAPQYQAYGQGTSWKELSHCKHALGEYLPKGWKSGPEKISGRTLCSEAPDSITSVSPSSKESVSFCQMSPASRTLKLLPQPNHWVKSQMYTPSRWNHRKKLFPHSEQLSLANILVHLEIELIQIL